MSHIEQAVVDLVHDGMHEEKGSADPFSHWVRHLTPSQREGLVRELFDLAHDPDVR